MVHDIIISMSDGLTVPFAIAAGISGASVTATIVVIAGLAEIAAGSISMDLGGYLSSRTDLEHYIRIRLYQRPLDRDQSTPLGPADDPEWRPCRRSRFHHRQAHRRLMCQVRAVCIYFAHKICLSCL